MFLVEIGPLAAEAVCAEQVEFFVMRQCNVFHGKVQFRGSYSSFGQQFDEIAKDLVPVLAAKGQGELGC